MAVTRSVELPTSVRLGRTRTEGLVGKGFHSQSGAVKVLNLGNFLLHGARATWCCYRARWLRCAPTRPPAFAPASLPLPAPLGSPPAADAISQAHRHQVQCWSNILPARAQMLRRFHDLVLACHTLTVPDAPDLAAGTCAWDELPPEAEPLAAPELPATVVPQSASCSARADAGGMPVLCLPPLPRRPSAATAEPAAAGAGSQMAAESAAVAELAAPSTCAGGRGRRRIQLRFATP